MSWPMDGTLSPHLASRVKEQFIATARQHSGGIMLHDLTGRNLQNLFVTDAWQDCFASLSESLGFSLSIFSRDGKMLYCPRHTASFCHRLRSSAPGLITSCDTHCGPFRENALATGKSEVFKCYLKVVSFVVPLRNKGEHAVILGQGSFSSLEDFHECRKLLHAAGLDVNSMSAPTGFTSYPKAWMVCNFTTDAVRRLLSNDQADHGLGKKFESLNKFINGWGVPTGEPPEVLYRYLLQELPLLTDADGSAIFVCDRKQRRYTSLPSHFSNTGESDAVSLCENGEIVQGLLTGKPFVFPAESTTAADAGLQKRMGGLFYFPIIVHEQLEAILCIADRYFKTSDTHIIAALCRQTARSIENNHPRQEQFHKLNGFVSIAELTRAITPIHNYPMLLMKILDESASLLTAEQGSLMLIDHETEDLLLSAKKGAVEGLTDQFRIHRGDGIAGRVAEFGEALLVEDLEHDQRIRQKNRLHYKTRSFISIPLKIGDRVIGVLNLSDKTTGEVFNEDDLKLIQAFATHAAIVMDRNVFLNKNEELEKLTITDHLTGLANRRYLFERLGEEVARSERHGHHLCLLMLDLDCFKHCNDTRGHQFGDKVLQDMALTIVSTIRSMDIASRYGGDEFIIILPETDEALAADIAERLRANLEKRFAGAAQDADRRTEERITASVGIACYPEHGTTIETLLKNVDTALYCAKKSGRNRIAMYDDRKDPTVMG
jgi:diguanylate cyclase (GGDEF)-like protein